MAKDDKKADKPAAAQPAGAPQAQQQQPGIQVIAQYVKDFSFENPNSPDSLVGGWGQPETNVQVALHYHPVKEDMYEGVLKMRVEAKKKGENKAVFIIDLAYGALVTVVNVPKENHQPVMMIEVPKLLFPFVREIVASATSNGGYPPLYLSPISFESIYVQEVQRRKAAGQS